MNCPTGLRQPSNIAAAAEGLRIAFGLWDWIEGFIGSILFCNWRESEVRAGSIAWSEFPFWKSISFLTAPQYAKPPRRCYWGIPIGDFPRTDLAEGIKG